MSPEPPEKLSAYAAKTGIEFELLSDGDLEATGAWGLVNETNQKLPHPTSVIVDTSGVIRWLRVDEEYRNRPSVEDLLAALDRIPSTSTDRARSPKPLHLAARQGSSTSS